MYFGLEFYGAGKHALELSKELEKLNCTLYILSSKVDPTAPQHLKTSKLFHLKTPGITGLDPFILGFKASQLISKLARKADVIHCYQFDSSIITSHSLPVIYKANETMFGTLKAYLSIAKSITHLLKIQQLTLASAIEKRICKNCDKIIAISEFIARELSSYYGIPKRKIVVIRDGVNLKRFKPVKHPNKDVIIYLGRLVPQKGVDLLIKALPLILKKKPKAKLLIIGKATTERYDKYLLNLAKKLRVHENIRFLGHIPHKKIPQAYSLADVCVIPSIYEPLGGVALEAMATQTPVVAFKAGGLTELLAEDRGFLANPYDYVDLAEKVVLALENKAEAKRRALLARKWVKKNANWKTTALKTVQTMRELISS